MTDLQDWGQRADAGIGSSTRAQRVRDANGGHTAECEATCHPSCPIGWERRMIAEDRAREAQQLWRSVNH